MPEASLELGKEDPPKGEELLIEKILTNSQRLMEREPHARTVRAQHAKSHGYVEGEFTVEENIPDDFKVGVFTRMKTYPIWIRFSNGNSDRDQTTKDFLPDTVGDVRGMAIKLMGVEGEMAITDPAHQHEQDFILMNNPTFFLRDVQGYLDFAPIREAIRKGKITLNPGHLPNVPDELQAQFHAISYALTLVEKIRAKSVSSPLEIVYWSATPYRFGKTAMKFSAVPHPTRESFDPETASDKSHYLREAMTKYLASHDAYFDFKIQLQKDAAKMLIEDPTVEWNEQDSPFVKVATIKIPSQNFNTADRKQLDEKQSFSPWHALLEHQPLGGVNRARKIYVELAKIRNKMNQGIT